MNPKTHLLIACITFLGCFVLLASRPVPAISLQSGLITTGKIINVTESETGDIMIRLKNDHRTYQIHPEIENKLNFELLRNNLLYRRATLNFAKQWTPSKSSDNLVPVASVSVSGQTYWQQPKARFVIN